MVDKSKDPKGIWVFRTPEEKWHKDCIHGVTKGAGICWRNLILSCSPHTYFRSCIRRNTFTLLLTQWLLRQRSTSVSFLRLNITTLHTRCDTIKHLSLDDETRTTVNSGTPAIPAAINTIRGIQHNCTLGQTALTSDMSS